MTHEMQRLLSDLDDVRHALRELLVAAEVTFCADGCCSTAPSLPLVLCRELDRVCDGLLGR